MDIESQLPEQRFFLIIPIDVQQRLPVLPFVPPYSITITDTNMLMGWADFAIKLPDLFSTMVRELSESII